jgi:protein involved in polysaccharide export with SLBB domain
VKRTIVRASIVGGMLAAVLAGAASAHPIGDVGTGDAVKVQAWEDGSAVAQVGQWRLSRDAESQRWTATRL